MASMKHMPEKGNMIIVYAPHVGLSKDGRLGFKNDKPDCSFVVNAFDAVNKKETTQTNKTTAENIHSTQN